MTPTSSQPRKFTFDTVFEGDRVVSQPKPRRTYTAEEVEAARAEGLAQGQRSAAARAEAEAAAALAEAARAIRAALGALTAVAQTHKADSARLALVCARRIADAALDQFPEQPVLAALDSLAREVEAQPRLIVRSAQRDPARLQAQLSQAAERAGFTGQVVVKADASLPPAAFLFDWGDGRAQFDPEAAAARVSAALEQALAAECLHAPPLLDEMEVAP